MGNSTMKAFVKTQKEFCLRFFAFLTSRVIRENIMESGYKSFISSRGPQRYHKSISDIGDYEAKKLDSATNNKKIFNAPVKMIKSFYYQRWISFIFIRPQIRRSIIVAGYLNRPIIFPLKSDWIEIFEENGFRFEKRVSITLWKLISMALVLRQLAQYIFFFSSYRPLRNSNKRTKQHSSYKKIFFCDFPANSLQSEQSDFQYKNSLAWIKGNIPGNSGLIAFSKHGNYFHNSNHIKLDKIYGHIILKKEVLIIFRLLTYIVFNFKNLKDICFLFLNLNEILEYNRVLCYRKEIFVDEVYFNCSLGATKPLWAYAAEKLGIENYLFFYATFTEPRFKINQVQLSGEWRLATWMNYIVPDQFLKSELISVIPKIDQKFHIFGVPWWIDCKEVIHFEKKPIVVIFDKAPRKSLYLFSLLAINGGDNEDYQQKFLSDILHACKNFDCVVLYKSKRQSNNFNYNLFIKKIESEVSVKFKVVSEEFAPIRLIKDAHIVISRAGSSTALIAKLEGKDSIIYDPTAIVNPNDPSYRDIPVIQNLMALKKYVT
jgi:polysaccharide biosynthesis PFTS motif protein